jgi:hypothetical protein
MSRAFVAVILVAFAAPARADSEAHATGVWVELAIDADLANTVAPVLEDVPQQHLVIGAQLDTVSIGLLLGGFHASGAPWRLDVGPTLRAHLLGGVTELVFEGSFVANIGLAADGMDDGGPTAYGGHFGLDARHWIDRHFAIGGGVIAHVTSVSSGGVTVFDVGIGAALRVSAVF